MDAENIRFTYELPAYCSQKYSDLHAFSEKINRKWHEYTFNDYKNISEKIAVSFLKLGIRKGENVATVFNYNCPQWNFIDMALAIVGAVHVPIYPTISDSDYLYILNQIESRFVIISDKNIFNRISEISNQLHYSLSFFSVRKFSGATHWKDLVNIPDDYQSQKLEERKRSIREDDVVSIVYTSGTTGFPKGVELSHRNIVSNLLAAAKLQPLGKGDRILSFLPLCHVYERTANYQFTFKGASIHYCDSYKALMHVMKEVKPHGTTVVPRLLEKIIKMVKTDAEKRNLFIRLFVKWSVSMGLRYNPHRKKHFFLLLSYKIVYLAVFQKLKKLMGGNLRYIGCGGAPINYKIKSFFWAAQMPVYEGYGLTECSPLVALNSPVDNLHYIKSVGPVIPGVEVKLASDGEILCKGPNVTSSYYKMERVTQETFENGWLKTGDLGKFVQGNFLQIVGRKKQMFKTSFGKYIVPQAIEKKFTESFAIDHLVVVGEGKYCAAAIISPNFEYFRNTVPEMKFLSNKKIAKSEIVRKHITNEIQQVNKKLGKTEQIRKFLIVQDKWSTNSGELSPTLKIKRNIIQYKYKRQIEQLFKEDAI